MSLSGFNHNLRWNEFREVNQRPANVSEDAEIAIAFRPNYQCQSPPIKIVEWLKEFSKKYRVDVHAWGANDQSYTCCVRRKKKVLPAE